MQLNGEIAKAQIEDRIREAEMGRRGPSRSSRQWTHRVVRKVGSGFLAPLTATLIHRPAHV